MEIVNLVMEAMDTGWCDEFKCSNCKINKQYKEFVGIEMGEADDGIQSNGNY